MKVVINDEFGAFQLSKKALELFGAHTGKSPRGLFGEHWRYAPEFRVSQILLDIVEELGQGAADYATHFKIVEVPDGIPWHIANPEGPEYVARDHETWR